jgi:cell division protein FtsB
VAPSRAGRTERNTTARRGPRHATRSLFGLFPRRRAAAGGGPPLPERVAGFLRLGSRSALTLGLGALMVIFIGLLIANFVGQIMQSASLEARRTNLEAEVATMEAENLRLQGAVEFTESDVYIERVAREQLGYAREGDVVILPRMPAATPVPAAPEGPAPDAPAPPATPNWRLWWEALFPPSA